MDESNVRESETGTPSTGIESTPQDRQPLRIRLVAAPQRERGLVPIALASGLLCPAAWAAPGDLDTSFGDVGRLQPWPELTYGTAWAVEALDEDELLVAGGDYYDSYYYGYYYLNDFATRLLSTGERDATFAAAQLDNTDVYDIAVQDDGKAIGVGSTVTSDKRRLTVFRLLSDGSLDAGFGSAGIVSIEDTAGGMPQVGRSVVIEPGPDGRIVVAGTRNLQLIVVRLLADGARDLAFGTAGIYEGPAGVAAGSEPRIVRAPGGGYRIAVHSDGCHVLALDASGMLDATYGTAGLAPADTQTSESVFCNAMAMQGDGAVLLAGSKDGSGFATRLLGGGAPDPAFAGEAVATVMSYATALAIGGNGSIMVAGHDKTGLSGALVVRLQADGHLDTLYGKSGSASIELDSEYGMHPTIKDMHVLTDGRVVVSGGTVNYRPTPFVARLLGAGGGPGVLSVQTRQVAATEQTGQATVTVQRTGGSSGPVSVAYNTVGLDDTATAGADFTATMGNLSWGDGDSSEREITVAIAADNDDQELEEFFEVALSAPVGGAGLGTRKAGVVIRGMGYPAGVFSVTAPASVLESSLVAQFFVNRNFYGAGAVSVTVTPVGVTATAGQDFGATPVTLTWVDGDMTPRLVEVPITRNKKKEVDETFTVALSAPTGGAIVAAEPPGAVRIVDNVGNTGGGGRFGAFGMLLLGFAGLLRGMRRPH